MPDVHLPGPPCQMCGRRYPFKGYCGYCRADLRAAGQPVPTRRTETKLPAGYESQHEARILAQIARVEREDPEMRRRREDVA